jgi:hypothetical protein
MTRSPCPREREFTCPIFSFELLGDEQIEKKAQATRMETPGAWYTKGRAPRAPGFAGAGQAGALAGVGQAGMAGPGVALRQGS